MFQEQGEIPCYGVFQRRRYGGHPSHNKHFSNLLLDLGALFDLRRPGLEFCYAQTFEALLFFHEYLDLQPTKSSASP